MSQVEAKLDQIIRLMTAQQFAAVTTPTAPTTEPVPAAIAGDEEALYQRIKARLLKEIPAQLCVLVERPEIVLKIERQVLEVNGHTLRGRIALLIREGFFDGEGRTGTAVNKEIEKRTSRQAAVGTLYGELDDLVRLGFLQMEPAKDKKSGKKYKSVEAMSTNIKAKQ